MAKFSPLATPSATREVLERHGLFTKYGLGQNFLVNDDIVGRILELADVESGDVILEVGPGIGTLTYGLLARGAQVVAVEKDKALIPVLEDTLGAFDSSFKLLPMDALDLTAAQLPSSWPCKLVSNLPYAVAATVVLDYLERFDFLESATVMVQKEVADRMTAQPGTKTYGAYTVKLSLYSQPAGRFPVAPGNFFPPPHVESAVLRLNRTVARDGEGHPLSSEQLRATATMADAAFANRRKTLGNSCKTYFAGRPEIQDALPALFEQAAIDPQRRGETLTTQEFIRLGSALREIEG